MMVQTFAASLLLLLVSLHFSSAQIGLTKLPLTKIGNGYYHFEKTNRNWFDAERFCRSNKMELLSLETKAEHDLVTAELIKQGMALNYELHVSGSDLGNEGSFSWRATGAPLTFTGWNTGEPNNANGNENCMTIVNKNGVVVWNDDDCMKTFWFVCELPTACWGFD